MATHYHIHCSPEAYGGGVNTIPGLEASFRTTLAGIDNF